MESKHYLELNLTKDFEGRFRRFNVGEYLMKYTAKGDYSTEETGIFTIEFQNDVSLLVEMKLYLTEDNENRDGCVFTYSSVLQCGKMKFEADLNGIYYEYDSYSYICSVQVIHYEKYKSIQNSAKKENVRENVTGSNGLVIESRLDHLSFDMRRLLAEGELSDVVLSDGSTDFRAHKVILSARSSVFSKMFQHSMKENCENRVTISDVRSEVLKELLTFIYTGIATIKDMKMARDLYVAADKYDIKELQVICSKSLKNVNLDSVFDTLALADLYRDESLKQSALEFVSENYSEIKRHMRWNSFMKGNQVLALEVLSFALDKRT